MADEYIRRQDAKAVLQEKVFHNLTDEFYGAMQALDELEPADVVPVVHGRWIWKPTKQYCPPDCWYPPISHEETWNEKDGTWLEDKMYCSACNYHNFEVKFKFCPNCGAKMDAQREDE